MIQLQPGELIVDSPARTQHVMERAPVYEPVL